MTCAGCQKTSVPLPVSNVYLSLSEFSCMVLKLKFSPECSLKLACIVIFKLLNCGL